MNQYRFQFGVNEKMEVQNGVFSGFVIDMNTVDVDGNLAPINDLNDIQINVMLKRGGSDKDTALFVGYLDEYLTALYAQTTDLELSKRPMGTRHQFLIDFLGGALELKGEDMLTIELTPRLSAFTGMVEQGSSVQVHMIPTQGKGTYVPRIIKEAIQTGNVLIDRPIGSNISKIVLATDFTTTYELSAKAKPDGTVTVTGNNYDLSITTEGLEAINKYYFDDNPESLVANLVLFMAKDGKLLNNANIRLQLTVPADAAARILSTQIRYDI